MRRRSVLVTGATSGIGLATARRLLGDGHRVVGTGRDLSKVEELTAQYPQTFSASSLDLADLEALPNRLAGLAENHPDLDALVLNAGLGLLGNLEELSFSQIRELLEVDLVAQIFCARAWLPGLKRRGGGDLLLMGSEAAVRGGRGGSVYCAAKFGLRGFAEALREECGKSGVRVTLLNPGMTRTPFFDSLPIEPGPDAEHALDPDTIAQTVAFVLSLPPEAVVDRIDLSPRTRVVRKRR